MALRFHTARNLSWEDGPWSLDCAGWRWDARRKAKQGESEGSRAMKREKARDELKTDWLCVDEVDEC